MSVPTSLLGSSAATQALDGDITAAARSDAKVLITGESGAGKEVAARLVHERSLRARMPLITLNCAGIPDGLLETELFGHVKGSFTGAYRDKMGLLQVAQGGTIFLDEIGEMTLRMQALLLRFLETGEIQRVGADRPTDRLDVRVICATHRDLRARIVEGTFREDLFYRLNVIHIHISPLRERRDDILVLLRTFLDSYADRHRLPVPTLSDAARDRLLRYDWPGNVRELRNVAERLVVRHRPLVDLDELPTEIRLGPVLEELEAGTIADVGPATIARRLLIQILDGESFWDVVYAPFEAHDLTREHLRLVISAGLEQTQGRYSALTELFNMRKSDYKKFLNALRKHDCLVSYHVFRNARSGGQPSADAPADVANGDAWARS